MLLTDGKKAVDIQICEWNGSGYGPDWSQDFFEVGSLPHDELWPFYFVPDVDHCREMAEEACFYERDMCVFATDIEPRFVGDFCGGRSKENPNVICNSMTVRVSYYTVLRVEITHFPDGTLGKVAADEDYERLKKMIEAAVEAAGYNPEYMTYLQD